MPRRGLTILLFVIGLSLPLFYATAGVVLSTHKYAWSDNVGYINFENVTVDDTVLGGYAWSANAGFIKFNPANGGVFNDGNGNLSGSAWGEQLGYIDFDNVSINTSTGQFSGTASGTLVGTINFDCPSYCDVQTDWRPTTATPTPFSGGSGSGQGAPASTTIVPGLPVLGGISPNPQFTKKPTPGLPVTSITKKPGFTGSVIEAIRNFNLLWILLILLLILIVIWLIKKLRKRLRK